MINLKGQETLVAKSSRAITIHGGLGLWKLFNQSTNRLASSQTAVIALWLQNKCPLFAAYLHFLVFPIPTRLQTGPPQAAAAAAGCFHLHLITTGSAVLANVKVIKLQSRFPPENGKGAQWEN